MAGTDVEPIPVYRPTFLTEGAQYKGLDRYACRKQLWADMTDAGLTLNVTKHLQRVPRSQRSGEVIEPMLSKQWFLKTEVMSQKAIEALSSGEIHIQPERSGRVRSTLPAKAILIIRTRPIRSFSICL